MNKPNQTMWKHLITAMTCICLLAMLGCEETLLTPEERAEKDDQAIQEYLRNHNIQGAEKTDGGVYYVITERPSNVGSHPTSTSTVTVKYRGTLLDGSEFDSSDSLRIRLSNTIPGWREAIPKFKKTWKGQLFIPSLMGYYSRPQPNIPAYSVLIFDIELLDFE